jgi:CubicO group peptidase (beta-lactamase class C family)
LSLAELNSILDSISNGTFPSEWNTSITSFSIEITSANSSFFTYNYTAPVRNESGAAVVGSNTIFRVASVTKVFTDLAILLEDKINMEDLISKFVPEMIDLKWRISLSECLQVRYLVLHGMLIYAPFCT